MSEIIQMLELAMKPVNDRLDRIDGKLDTLAHQGERIATVEQSVERLHRIEAALPVIQNEQAKTQGQNLVICWLLTIIGGPIVVGLALAGITSLYNHSGPVADSRPPHEVLSQSTSNPEPHP